jgi:hypothetical protein
MYEVWGSHGREDVDVDLLGCNAVWTCVCIAYCHRIFSPEDEGSIFFRNVGIYLQVHTAL